MNRLLIGLALGLLLALPFASAATNGAGVAPSVATRYFPATGDGFHYYEEITVTNGAGSYLGYTEGSFVNGSIAVTGLAPPQTVAADYASSTAYRNSTGAHQQWTSGGTFTFSANTFHYVQGTDNQTGYVNPYVWFYIDNTLAPGASFFLLNSQFSLVGTDASYASPIPSTGYAKTLFGEGNGSYPRNDSYGKFDAAYNWKVYFDPGTGYIVGYVYTEQDTDTSGDSFTYTDTLAVTQTTYALTPASAPPSSSSPGISNLLLYGLLLLVVLVIIVVIAYAVLRSRRTPNLPRHSAGGQVAYNYAAPPPPGPAPPPLHFNPQDQPSVQQVVVREKVMVNCRYCGALMEPEAANCPKCGAPRS